MCEREVGGKNNKNEETYILNAVCVCLVLHDGVGRQVEDSAQGVSDASSGRLVTRCFVPDGDNVLLGSREHNEKAFLRMLR